MAEGLARALLDDSVEIESAGAVASHVNPLALRVLEEIGIDGRGQTSKSVDGFDRESFDHVVTLCDEQVCPTTIKTPHLLHHPIADPTHGRSEAERLARFRAARDQIKALIEKEFSEHMRRSPAIKLTTLFWTVMLASLSVIVPAHAKECVLDSSTRVPVDMIVDQETKNRICVLNLKCGKSQEAVYCRPVDERTCPGVEECLGKALPLQSDSSHAGVRNQPDDAGKAGKTNKEGSINVDYLDPPSIISPKSGATCVGDARFTIFTNRGAKSGVSPVVGRPSKDGTSCPSAESLARDRSVRFMSNEGRPPQLTPRPDSQADSQPDLKKRHEKTPDDHKHPAGTKVRKGN